MLNIVIGWYGPSVSFNLPIFLAAYLLRRTARLVEIPTS